MNGGTCHNWTSASSLYEYNCTCIAGKLLKLLYRINSLFQCLIFDTDVVNCNKCKHRCQARNATTVIVNLNEHTHRTYSVKEKSLPIHLLISRVFIKANLKLFQSTQWCRGVVVMDVDSQYRGSQFDSSVSQ